MIFQFFLFIKRGWFPTSLFFHSIFLISIKLFSQNDYRSQERNFIYEFKIIEGVSKTTLNQSYSNVITANRLLSRALEDKDTKLAELIKMIIPTIGIGISHEEGHRSVLTDLRIGSISQPFSFDTGLLYVKGVSNKTLIDLRDSSLPDFIHLHSAGLESDYMSILELENTVIFGFDDFNHIKYDYLTRKISHVFYFVSTIAPFLIPDFKEEENELERDIVGHDILGAIRHLHRPNDSFYRYTFFDDLTNFEKGYARKIVLFSLSNLVNPILFGKKYFSLPNDYVVNFSLGYSLAPFGGHFDQNFWLKKDKLNLHVYCRQFHNKNSWFLGLGARVANYSINDNSFLNAGLHYWNQPTDLSFHSTEDYSGIGGEIDFGLKLFSINESKNDVYVVTGIRYKTKGFLPGYTSLEERAQINMGFAFSW